MGGGGGRRSRSTPRRDIKNEEGMKMWNGVDGCHRSHSDPEKGHKKRVGAVQEKAVTVASVPRKPLYPVKGYKNGSVAAKGNGVDEG